MTIEELFLGKETIIKDKQYFSAKKYSSPFIDKMKTYDATFKIYAKSPDQVSCNDGKGDIIYNRVLINAILPQKIGDYNECISFTYSLDVKKPIAEFYKCYINTANDLCISLDQNKHHRQEIKELEPISYNPVKELITDVDLNKSLIKSLEDQIVDREKLDELLGSWIRRVRLYEYKDDFGKVKLATGNAITAFEMLFVNNDSEYYCEQDSKVSLFDCYEAFAQTIKDDKKDITNKFEKLTLIKSLLCNI